MSLTMEELLRCEVATLKAELEAVKRERDAAIEAMEMMSGIETCCIFCKHLNKRSYRCESNAKANGSCWEWVGVTENEA